VISRALTKVGLNNEIPYRYNDTEILCSICLDAMEEEKGDLLTVSGCEHTFHRTCIVKWKEVSRKCPCCRGALSDEIGPRYSVLRNLANLPAEEVELYRNEDDMATNWGNLCVGFIYPLLLVPFFIAFEALIFSILVILMPWVTIYFIFADGKNDIMASIVGSILLFILCPFLVCGMVVCFMLQIFYMLFRTLKFYVYWLMCKIPWYDALPFIIQRTISVSEHCNDVLFRMLD